MLYRKKTAPLSTCRLLLAVLLLIIPGVADAKSGARSSRPVTDLADQYRQAKTYYQELIKSSGLSAERKNWLTAARNFRKIYQADQNSEQAPPSLFMLARTYRELYGRHHDPLDLGEAIAYNEDLVALYSHHRLADDALMGLVQIYQKERPDPDKAKKYLAELLEDYPDGDMAAAAAHLVNKKPAPGMSLVAAPEAKPSTAKSAAPPASPGAPLADLRPLRYWTTSNYTRVVIETSAPVTYKENLLDPTGNQPRRLYIDLDHCRVSPDVQKPIPIDDGLLRQVRSGQFKPAKVRVVLDTKSVSDYKVFSLQDPFRIVIDVRGQHPGPSNEGSQEPNTPAPTLAQQLGLGIKRIIVDPGHGGKDCGAIGIGGMLEKDITLAVAREVAARLRSQLECEVVMTRDSDVFIPLEERTAIANTREGDLFISIHVNAAPSPKVRGIETYILDLAKNKNAMQVAARENASSAHQLSNLQSILQDLIQNSKKSESIKLAEYVQGSMVSGLKGDFPEVKDLGVKQAPFVVLLGAQMPAILTEIAFLSNPEEAEWLRSEKYQGEVADQIVAGVTGYANDLNLTAQR